MPPLISSGSRGAAHGIVHPLRMSRSVGASRIVKRTVSRRGTIPSAPADRVVL